MKKVFYVLALSVVSVVVLYGCSQNSPTAPGSLSAQGQNYGTQAQFADGGCLVTGMATITKGMFYHEEVINFSGQQGTAIFEAVHLGHWDIYVALSDAQGQVLYAGIGSAVVKPNKVAEVTIEVTDDVDSVTPKPTPPGQGNPPENKTGKLVVNIEVPETCGLILWSKLGLETEVLNSEVGPNGQIVGDLDYKLGKYGNGFEPQPRTGDPNIPDNFIKYQGLNLGPQGCIEFWYLPDWIDSSVGHVVNIIVYGRPDEWQTHVIRASYNDWQNRLGVSIEDNGRTQVVAKYFIPQSISDWSTTVPFHFAITWDGTLSNAADKLKIFINGNEVGIVNTIVGNPTFTNWDNDFQFALSSRIWSGDWYRHHWEPDNGVIDNIKIWNYPKTDFSDRFVE